MYYYKICTFLINQNIISLRDFSNSYIIAVNIIHKIDVIRNYIF